jgi:hypothetical protein
MSGFWSDEELRELEAALDAQEEAALERREERIAIQIHDGGLSEEEALQSSTSSERTCTDQDNQPSDKHDSSMNSLSRNSCSFCGIQEEIGVSGSCGGIQEVSGACRTSDGQEDNREKECALKTRPAIPCAGAREDVVKADMPDTAACDTNEHEQESTEFAAMVEKMGNEATGMLCRARSENWDCLTGDGKIAAAKGDLLIDNIAGILRAHFDVQEHASRALAFCLLPHMRNHGIKDPLKFLTDELAIKWTMCNATGDRYREPGQWLFSEVKFYAKYNILDDAQKASAATPKKTNWSAIRQSIINCGRVGGDSMRGADLSDYVAHIQSTTRRFDPEVSHALGALGAAGLIERRSGGISVRAEVLQIPAEKKQRISAEKAMDHLREVVERCYPDTQDWRATVDSLFPLMKFWRSQTNPDMILGLADQIEGMARK